MDPTVATRDCPEGNQDREFYVFCVCGCGWGVLVCMYICTCVERSVCVCVVHILHVCMENASVCVLRVTCASNINVT